MQVKFLSRKHQLKLALSILGADLFKWNQSHFDSSIGVLLENAKRDYVQRYGDSNYFIQKLKDLFSRLDGMRLLTISTPIFEDNGTDVSYELSYGYGDFYLDEGVSFLAPEFFKALWNCSNHLALRIELKPNVGDDFPAVLRQLKADKSNVLLLQAYTGSGASWAEFVSYFASQRITVVLEADIEEITLPRLTRR